MIRNLPYALADVTKICKSCQSCSELKSKFYRPIPGKLIRATQPFERISVDFKGPLLKSKTSKNRFILTIVDEISFATAALPPFGQKSYNRTGTDMRGGMGWRWPPQIRDWGGEIVFRTPKLSAQRIKNAFLRPRRHCGANFR